MTNRFLAPALILTALLVGCATNYDPVPAEYTGPTAVIRDSGLSEGLSKAQMFAVMEIDGKSVMNAFRASYGIGATLYTTYPERKVKPVPMKLTLRGSHATGTPIHAIASQVAGTFYSVDGVVEFEPKAGAIYVVNGKLTNEGSSVWIEDGATGQPVTAIISK